MANKLTAERARELFDYDPETGALVYQISTSSRSPKGHIAGGLLSTGYRHVRVDAKRHLAHRVVWLWVYGEWPKGQIDHINGVRHDNRIANLRDVSPSVNQQNQRGVFGAHKERGRSKWRVRIRHNGKALSLGYFPTPEEAHAAYLEAKRKLHEGCTI